MPTDILDRLPADFKKVDILVNNAGLVYGTDHVGDMYVACPVGRIQLIDSATVTRPRRIPCSTPTSWE
jgi:NAD(P)-dependent dehydrogenase (short-subunit alcohol dehydrogenase family)